MTRTADGDELLDRSVLAPLQAMLEELDRASLAELSRAMVLALRPPETAKEKRIRELGYLASLVNAVPLPTHLTFAVVERKTYDASRPESAPPSARLVERYGSWRRACYHAYGLLPDGRWRGPGNPWPMHLRGRSMPPDYQRHEIPAAIRQCAFALCVRPSSTTFFRWGAAKRARARAHGLNVRIPGERALYLHYPADAGGYNRALADARILDDELDEAWHNRLGVDDQDALTPEDYIRAMPTNELVAAGLSLQTARQLKRRSTRKIRPSTGQNLSFSTSGVVENLVVSDALRLAVWIGASLEWLAGATSTIGAPPDPARLDTPRLDVARVRSRRVELGLREAAILHGMQLQLGPYRRLMRGQREATVGEIVRLARTLRLEISELIDA